LPELSGTVTSDLASASALYFSYALRKGS